jgi:Fe(3+) dicitrate transport protein
MKKILFIVTGTLWFMSGMSQSTFTIKGTVSLQDEPADHATVILMPQNLRRVTNENGFFRFTKLDTGFYEVKVSYVGHVPQTIPVHITGSNETLNITLIAADESSLENVIVAGHKNENVSGKLQDVSGTAIYAGKKTELINLKNINANLATNNTRQIYARIPGLNIWEYDYGGLQLGIGGRGLSPNRSSNFNIRQNGYDISADALGYPESYYTPSSEAMERIEIVRGAASLQYGPQFGGLVNFVMKKGPLNDPVRFTTRQTIGSFGFFNSFNSLGGTLVNKKLNYYTFYQYKKGDSWRPNSHFDQHNAYAHLSYDITPRFTITGEYTLMKYLAQQPGGLTDEQFNEDPAVSVRARNWFKVNWNLVALILDYRFNDHSRINWRNYTLQGGRDALGILSYINRPDNGGNRDLLSDKYENYASELRFIHNYTLGKQQSTFLAGARYYRGLTNRKQGRGSDDQDADFDFVGPEPDASSFRFPGNNIALFAENVFRINSRWNVTPGIRFEHIDTKADGYYYKRNIFIADEKIVENKSNPRSFVLLGIGSSWKFTNGTELYANISQNYRSINFNDIRVVNANAKVDPDLKDEDGFNIDAGFRGTYKGWLYADISAFLLKYNNRIGSIFTRDTSFMTYRLRTNVSDSRNLGVELLLDGDILKAIRKNSKYKLNLYTSLSLIDARYINTKNTAIADKLVENVPPVVFRTGISFSDPHFNVTCQFAYQGKQYSDATNTEITPTAVDGAIPAFNVIDLSLSYRWKVFTFYTGINNLANERYFTRRADGYPGPGIIPSDKRNGYITVQLVL